jgi:hypothetical protein
MTFRRQICVCLIFLCDALLSLCGCGVAARTHEVRFVVPNGFRGALKIVLDEHEGIALTRKKNIVTIDFPVSGVVHVRDLSLLRDWHTERAFFKDGTEIPTERPSTSPTSFSLRSLGEFEGTANPNTTQVYFLGTSDEAAAYVRSFIP